MVERCFGGLIFENEDFKVLRIFKDKDRETV